MRFEKVSTQGSLVPIHENGIGKQMLLLWVRIKDAINFLLEITNVIEKELLFLLD